jgi:3-hydroxyacyl-CoA dehydrogenase/enoyl-CoA hydratase/3-hydroxybutyryl-CoA epimerase
LACHRRFIVDDPKAVVGLPEVKVGLLPGAGGTQRVVRLIGLAAAAKMITDGGSTPPQRHSRWGSCTEVVARDQLLAKAIAWVGSAGDTKAPWDVKGFSIPGGSSLTQPPAVSQTLSIGTALITKMVGRRYPAPGEIAEPAFTRVRPFPSILPCGSSPNIRAPVDQTPWRATWCARCS